MVFVVCDDYFCQILIKIVYLLKKNDCHFGISYYWQMSERSVKIQSVIIHLTIWLAYGMIVFYWLLFVFNSQTALLFTIRILVLNAFLFYTNTYILLPKFVEQSKYILYIIAVLVIIGIVYFLMEWTRSWSIFRNAFNFPHHFRSGRFPIHEHFFFRAAFSHILSSVAVLFISTIYWMISQNRKKKQWELSLLNENLQTEMKFLKSQINPHFLFNALNNIYSLSITKSGKASEMILKLSGMLRYVLYECNSKKVPLGKEITYIENFIDFQLLKIEGTPHVMIDFERVDPNLQVEPMLFIPFIENSFKHSNIEDIDNGWITMTIETEVSQIIFKIKNSIPSKDYSKDKSGGIGLQNIKKRLQLLYADMHKLIIHQDEKTFSVYLTIDTK